MRRPHPLISDAHHERFRPLTAFWFPPCGRSSCGSWRGSGSRQPAPLRRGLACTTPSPAAIRSARGSAECVPGWPGSADWLAVLPARPHEFLVDGVRRRRGVMAMPNYWLGIMALTLAATLGIWILLVLGSGGKSLGCRQDNSPHREVLGGTFEARRGGRQVMPNPMEPITQEPGLADGEQAHASGATGQVSNVKVPEQGKGPVAEETPARSGLAGSGRALGAGPPHPGTRALGRHSCPDERHRRQPACRGRPGH